MINHQNNFATNLTSNQTSGVTTTPLNSIPSIAAPFYLAFDATNTNGKYEVVYVTSKTATNVNHAATSYAHTTSEEVRMIVPAVELDNLDSGVANGWVTYPEGTWTASDANTISVTVDLTSVLQKGDKLKLTNNSATKYFYVTTTPSWSGSATTFDVTGETDLVAGAITSPYYSKIDNPQGFKKGEIWYNMFVSALGTQNVNDASTTAVSFSEIFDTNNNFSSNTYTVPITGKYLINVQVDGVNSGGKLAGSALYVYKNGSGYVSTSGAYTATYNTVASPLSKSFLSNFTKGDTLDIRVNYDTSDSSTTLVSVATFSVQFVSV